MGLTRQTVKRCLERAAELGVVAALDDRARSGRDPAITAAARAWLAARCAHRLVIDRGRWVSAELPDYCDLDGV